jgi:hypothetical protein
VARRLLTIETCDWCKKLGLEDVEAERSVHLGIDGPPKRFEFCQLHLLQLEPLLELCQDEKFGVDESLKPKRRGQQKQQQELEPSPWINAREPEQPTQLEVVPAESEKQEEPTEKPSKYQKDVWVVCPLPHPTQKGGPKRVRYSIRATHAEKAHDGLKLWDIRWEDPDGVFTVKCEAHAECEKTGLGFTSELGLKQHIKASPLEKLPEVS